MEHKDEFQQHRLVITGSIPTPVELHRGVSIIRHDMKTTQEEADTILVQQVAYVEPECALVIADDTDVFVMLVHFCFYHKITDKVYMVSPVHGRAVLDIKAVVEKHHQIIPDLLAAHGLTGCDTVGAYHGIGKGVALRVMKTNNFSLNHLGDTAKSLPDIIPQSTSFMLACYNQTGSQSMTEARHKIWVSKVSRSTASAPKLQTLPPTTEAFKENVARAHLQVAIWKNALDATPPAMNPTDYGWTKAGDTESLLPCTVHNSVPLVPKELLQLIKCGCHGNLPCSTQRCGCRSTGIVCTMFCACHGGDECWNSMTNSANEEEDVADNRI